MYTHQFEAYSSILYLCNTLTLNHFIVYCCYSSILSLPNIIATTISSLLSLSITVAALQSVPYSHSITAAAAVYVIPSLLLLLQQKSSKSCKFYLLLLCLLIPLIIEKSMKVKAVLPLLPSVFR